MPWSFVFIALITAQIVADFAVRREILSRRKASRPNAWIHIVVLWAAPAIPFAVLMSNAEDAYLRVQVACLVFTLIHLAVDWLFGHTSVWSREIGSRQRWLFVAQQALKVFSAAAVAIWACPMVSSPYGPLGLTRFGQNGPSLRDLYIAMGSPLALAFVFGYVFSVFGGDAFVSLVLTKLSWETPDDGAADLGAGRLIGTLEAILITTFVIAHQYTAIGVVLAAKSVARYEWLKDKQGRAEYFLVGTLANLTWSMIGGLLVMGVAQWIAMSA